MVNGYGVKTEEGGGGETGEEIAAADKAVVGAVGL
jgi:hypothetical protein